MAAQDWWQQQLMLSCGRLQDQIRALPAKDPAFGKVGFASWGCLTKPMAQLFQGWCIKARNALLIQPLGQELAARRLGQ